MTERNNGFFPGGRMLGRVVAILSLVAIAGCAPLSILPEPPQLYTLNADVAPTPDAPEVDWTLLVEQPLAPAGLDTAQILISRSPATLDYYSSVAWVDRAPSMVQRLLVEGFERSGKIVGVSRDAASLRGDYLLRTELRTFQAERWDPNAPPRVRVTINAKLIRLPDRDIITGRTFEAVQPAASAEFDDVIAAFDTAVDKVLQDIVAWTLIAGEQRAEGRPASRRS